MLIYDIKLADSELHQLLVTCQHQAYIYTSDDTIDKKIT